MASIFTLLDVGDHVTTLLDMCGPAKKPVPM